ncbi:phosphotransferase [Streptomyces sp. 11x1]|uniref:phosphotransferase n=1 Tax=Streptomyces sp. 11x1 TaxID=3038642 RepID=UPI0037D9955B
MWPPWPRRIAVCPSLARHVPLPVPEPVAVGAPGAGYPFPWSVRRWLPGETVEVATGVDRPPDVTRTSVAAIPASTATRSRRPWSGWRTPSTSRPAGPWGPRR